MSLSTGAVCRTNLPSNTAMRGFGGPQGIAAVENVIEEIAAYLGIDALDVRRRNCYDGPGRDTTHYGQVVANNTLPVLIDQLAATADYARRRDQIARFNATARTQLRGIALVPVKFGISFTRRALNQANALVNIYLDGTIQVSTGGTEMGQGLNTKIRQIVADEFALPLEAVRVMPTSTEKNNNTSPTAASASTDLNGTAALRAAEIFEGPARRVGRPPFRIGRRMESSLRPRTFALSAAAVHDIRRPGHRLDFDELVKLAYEERVDLGRAASTRPLGSTSIARRAVAIRSFTSPMAPPSPKSSIDRLTGELTVMRVDILMDLGHSLQSRHRPRPGDRRVCTGHGLGHDRRAALHRNRRLLSNSPNNYKIPGMECMPRILRSTSWTIRTTRSTCWAARRWVSRRLCWGSAWARPPSQRFPVCRPASRRPFRSRRPAKRS